MAYERDRGGARRRGYDARWDKASATFRSRRPWCLGCQVLGKKVATELVDHVEPHKGDQAKFWNTAMWQPSCRWHHDVVKKLLEGMFERGEIKVADLWLNSATAQRLSRIHERKNFGSDGWAL